MAAPAGSSTTATTTAGQDEAAVKATKPLPRAIQMVLAISYRSKPRTTTSTSTKTIGEHGPADRFLMWIMLVLMPSMFIAVPALSTYGILHDHDEVGLVFLAVLVLPHVYLALVSAAWGHLGLFAPQTPHAAWEGLGMVGFVGMGLPVIFTSLGALLLYTLMPDQAWLLLVTCAYLLGLLVASTIAFWLCLLRTYGGGGSGGEPLEMNSSCGEAIINGLAYPYCRLLYEFAARFLADADAGMQQFDTGVLDLDAV